jgi:hypothetical protein
MEKDETSRGTVKLSESQLHNSANRAQGSNTRSGRGGWRGNRKAQVTDTYLLRIYP